MHEEMDVVGHEAEVGQGNGVRLEGRLEQGAVRRVILRLLEDRLATIPPRHYVIVASLTGQPRTSAHS